MAFRAVQETKPVFIADSCAFLAGAAAVIPVLHWFGVIGSGIGMVITNLVGLLILVLSMQVNDLRSRERIQDGRI
jgi:Na+-driven multidrug efflux pump